MFKLHFEMYVFIKANKVVQAVTKTSINFELKNVIMKFLIIFMLYQYEFI